MEAEPTESSARARVCACVAPFALNPHARASCRAEGVVRVLRSALPPSVAVTCKVRGIS